MKFELNTLPRNCSDEDLFSEIRRVDSIVGKEFLTRAKFDKYGKINASTIVRRFGSWQEALKRVGLGHKYSGKRISEKMLQQRAKELTNDEIIGELQRIAKLLGKDFLTTKDINNNSTLISSALVPRRFGSFQKGVELARLKVSKMYRRKYSDEEYFENLLNVWTHYGRQPLYREMDEPPSEISAGAYENHFGSWRKALEAFVVKMNQENESYAETEKTNNLQGPKETVREEIRRHSVLVEDGRGISLGLRYKALGRDKFKCVKCGASPATVPTCTLQIDHIIPLSKGGKTILENLQTLCKECNLGKGNRHFD